MSTETECMLVFRPVRGRLYVKTPYLPQNRGWFKSLGILAKRDGDYWRVSRKRFTLLIKESIDRFGCAEVWTDHLNSQECNASCLNARGSECVCSCLYRNHGTAAGTGQVSECWHAHGAETGEETTRVYWTVSREEVAV